MTYQIPQQLEYKEKIMFGLTFKQLIYASIFTIIAVLFLRIIPNFKMGFSIALIVAFIGVGFVFFDFGIYLKNLLFYFKFRKIVIKKTEINKYLGIKAIKDKLIYMEKGRRIAILKIFPMNFSIKLLEEKQAIMSSFQKLLNSLDFPTQIIINTEGLELSKYLDTLKTNINQDSLLPLFEDYKKYLEETINNKKIMNRLFYLVVPEQSDIEIQLAICAERFSTLNLKVERLDDSELKKLIDSFLVDPDQDSEKISITNHATCLKKNTIFYRTIFASGYPRSVDPGFLDRIVSLQGDFNLSIHIQPYPIENMLVDLNRELQKQRGDLYSMNLKGIINPSLEIQYSDTRKTLETLQKGKERLFNVCLYITCKSDKLKDLNTLTKKIEAELNSIMIAPKIAKFRMLQGFQSTLPLSINTLKEKRNVTTRALSAFFPFTSQFLQADNSGVWLGLNKNNIPIIKDIFNLPNPNGVVLAQSGGGKSYFCKLLITRYLLNGTKVMIIDPQGEYKALVKRFGGQIIDLSRESKTLINPLDLMGHDYTEKRLSLMDLLPVMFGNLSEPQKAFLDKAITLAYKKMSIDQRPKTWGRNPPILKDLLDALNKLMSTATQLEKSTLRSVINRVDMYVNGVFNFLNKKTNLKLNNRLVCFDLGNMPKQIKPVVMFLVLDYVYMKMKSDLNRKILLVDEAWSLLSRTEDAGYILEIVKTCRKFNLGLLLINQEVEDLFNSRAGKSVLANSAYTLLLRQKPSVIKNVCEAFRLSPSERELLLTSNVGEGLLIMEDEHSLIKVKASPEEHKIITTKADELLVTTEPIKQSNEEVTVDLDNEFQRKRGLSKAQVEELIENGFKELKRKSLASGKTETFLLHQRHNESINHMFVIYDIAEYLEKKGIKVEKFATRKPDLVFEINGKKCAIEVETGSKIDKDRKSIEKKVQQLNKNYSNWCFIVTMLRQAKKYRKYGSTVDMRYVGNYLKKLLKLDTAVEGSK